MANEFKGLKAHSAEYFGDTRDHWWNADFLELAARDWQADGIRAALDVGCGVGHWGRALARVLPRTARLTGIDREALWIAKATERAAAAGLAERFSYRVGTAEALPFDDVSFDLATCQTLLMHVVDPARVLAEMIRVVRPGGLIAVAEPTNVASVILDAFAVDETPEVTASLVYFQLLCERGKKALGEGDSFIGEKLPLMFDRAGLTGVSVRQNDHCWMMLPPYRSALERATVEEFIDMAARDIYCWDEAATRRFFLAGGGRESDFAAHWSDAMSERRRAAEAMRAKTYTCMGGGLFYLVWGRKP